jgi:branched-chain amino acid transport system substrate-binding protein
MKRQWSIVLILVFVFSIGIHPVLYAAQKVIIGSAQPLTGPSSNDGRMSSDGAQLAVELAKDNTNLKKYNIEFISQDDKSDPKEAAAIANKFVGEKDLFAVIGNYNSSCTLAGAPIYTKAGIVQISPGSSSPKITGFSKYLFRTNPTDKVVGQNIVAWAKEMGLKKIAIIYENSDFGKGLQSLYMEFWPTDTKYEIVANESYIPGSTYDFTSILTKVKNSGAEGVLLGSLYNEAALIAKQAKQLQVKLPFFGDVSQHTNALLELGKENVDGWNVVGAMDESAKDPLTTSFLTEFQKRYGHKPNTFAAQAFDATNIILTGLAENGQDPEKLAEFVTKVKEFPGVTGKLTFNNGDVEKQLFRFTVKDGAFHKIK